MSASDGERKIDRALRPHLGGRGGEVPQERAPRFRSALLSKLARIGRPRSAAHGRPPGVATVRDVKAPRAYARRCVVKARFVAMDTRGKQAAALHLGYIERDGVGPDGSPGRLYGADEAFSREDFARELPSERRQFRFIVSPEDATGDLTAYTRRLVAQMESDLGRRLVWAAANHWNTGNPHVHLVIRGVDRDGDDVTIDGRYIAQGVRARAAELLTRELGPRTRFDLERQRAREVSQERYTSVDRALERHVGPDGTVRATDLAPQNPVEHARFVARLDVLQKLGVAHRVSPVQWTLLENWAATLKTLGIRNDIIKRMHAAVPGADAAGFQLVDGRSPVAPVEGVVRAKGQHDELSGRAYVVIEAADGRLFHTTVSPHVAASVRTGAVVRLAVVARPRPAEIDRAIAATAANSGGVYSCDAPDPKVRSRLRELAAAGLIVELPGARWAVAANLLEQLELADRSSPPALRTTLAPVAPRLEVQRRYPGPTWLDGLSDEVLAGLNTSGGLGAEIIATRARRVEFLERLGVPIGPPAARFAALEAIELRHVAAKIAVERPHLSYVPSPEGSITGRVELLPALPSRRQYALVVDRDRGRFALVLVTKRIRALGSDAEVSIARTKDGRLAAFPARPLGRGR